MVFKNQPNSNPRPPTPTTCSRGKSAGFRKSTVKNPGPRGRSTVRRDMIKRELQAPPKLIYFDIP